MAKKFTEIYVRMALEESPTMKSGAVHISSNFGSSLTDICKRDTKLFAVGADTVTYNNQSFQKEIDQASISNGYSIREMWYYPMKLE